MKVQKLHLKPETIWVRIVLRSARWEYIPRPTVSWKFPGKKQKIPHTYGFQETFRNFPKFPKTFKSLVTRPTIKNRKLL